MVCYAGAMAKPERQDQCCSGPPAPTPSAGPERVVALFRALADPTRLQVFRLIAGQAEPICVCEVVERFSVSQPTISHHLRILRDAGLVTVSRRGVWAYYAVNPRGLQELQATLASLLPERLEAVS
jgi:ArsR family transcriptional regulator, arsenate/arsenite/antimonite-responsive transcriptional repressor